MTEITISPETVEAVAAVASHLWTLILVPLEMLRQRIKQHSASIAATAADIKALDSDINAIQLNLAQTLTHKEVREIVTEVVDSCFHRLDGKMTEHHALIDAKFRHHDDVEARIEAAIDRLRN